MLTYSVLWETLKRKGMTGQELLEQGITAWEMERLKNDGRLSTETIDKLCRILQCNVCDVVK